MKGIACVIFLVLCLQASRYECGKKKLGIFWGSNLAQKHGQEASLQAFCDRNVFDIIVITSVTSYIPTLNLENLPSLDFRGHCSDNVLRGEKDLTTYLKCPTMENHIKYCQSRGIKIVLDIRMTTGFTTKQTAEDFAEQVWGLFLGGNFVQKWRTFGSAVLDGINLTPVSVTYAVETRHIADFVRALRNRMLEATNKQYYLTFTPDCDQKPHALYTVFQQLFSAFDSIYVNFAQKSCKLNDKALLTEKLQVWMYYAAKSNGPLLYIGTTTEQNSQTFIDRNTTKKVVEDLFDAYPLAIGGMIFKDASWDVHNVVNGLRYSEFVKKMIADDERKNIPPPTPPVRVLFFGHASACYPNIVALAFVLMVSCSLLTL